MNFLVQLGLAGIGIYVFLILFGLSLFLLGAVVKFVRRPVSNKTAFVASGILIAMAVSPLVYCVVGYLAGWSL
jgi:hypothetical protein